jgi:hypothetical protein
MTSETLEFISHLTRLSAQEEFIEDLFKKETFVDVGLEL